MAQSLVLPLAEVVVAKYVVTNDRDWLFPG